VGLVALQRGVVQGISHCFFWLSWE
jgi:hypothetical protein